MFRRRQNLAYEIRVKATGVTRRRHQRAIRKYARPGRSLHPRIESGSGVSLWIGGGCLRPWKSRRIGYVPQRTAPMVASLIRKKEPVEIEVETVLPPSEEWDTLGLRIIIRY